MRAANITPGAVLTLTPSAKERYGLAGPFEVALVQARQGYKTPWIYCKSRRPEGGLLAFRPSDFARTVSA